MQSLLKRLASSVLGRPLPHNISVYLSALILKLTMYDNSPFTLLWENSASASSKPPVPGYLSSQGCSHAKDCRRGSVYGAAHDALLFLAGWLVETIVAPAQVRCKTS